MYGNLGMCRGNKETWGKWGKLREIREIQGI